MMRHSENPTRWLKIPGGPVKKVKLLRVYDCCNAVRVLCANGEEMLCSAGELHDTRPLTEAQKRHYGRGERKRKQKEERRRKLAQQIKEQPLPRLLKDLSVDVDFNAGGLWNMLRTMPEFRVEITSRGWMVYPEWNKKSHP